MLAVVFGEFEVVYMFLLYFSSFHYHCQLVKGPGFFRPVYTIEAVEMRQN